MKSDQCICNNKKIKIIIVINIIINIILKGHKPRMTLPSFLYCSIGKRIRSATPDPMLTNDRIGVTPDTKPGTCVFFICGNHAAPNSSNNRCQPLTW